MEEALKLGKVSDCRIAPYSPNVNGQIERYNSTIKKKLGILASRTGKPWSSLLPFVLYQYNNSIHATTKASPMEALRGVIGTPHLDEKSVSEYLEKLHNDIKEESKKSAKREVLRHNKKAKVITYNVGDKVICKDPKSKSKQKKKSFDTPLYKYEATIEKVGRSTNYKYLLRWGSTGGPTEKEQPDTLSIRYWSGKHLKLVERAPQTPIRSRTKGIKKRRKRPTQVISLPTPPTQTTFTTQVEKSPSQVESLPEQVENLSAQVESLPEQVEKSSSRSFETWESHFMELCL